MKDFNLKIVQEKENKRFLIEDNAGSFYQVSELVYSILFRKQKSITDAAIADDMNKQYNTNQFTPALINETIEIIKDKIKVSISEKNSSYIKLRQTVIKEGAFFPVYKLLSKFFKGWVIAILSCISAVVTVVFFFVTDSSSVIETFQEAVVDISAANAILLYMVFMAIILVHEIGHAAASYSFGIKPKEIGIGIYLIFPVLYTNVSHIWLLNAKKRLIVNFAGIYFQLLINLLLFLLHFITIQSPFWFLLICMNSISILCSLNPFFRYDAYWIYSDWFNLPNLGKQSRNLIIAFLNGAKIKYKSISLVVYTLCNILFWALLYYEMTAIVISHTGTLKEGGLAEGSISLVKAIFPILLFSLMLFFFLKDIFKLLKKEYHASTRLFGQSE